MLNLLINNNNNNNLKLQQKKIISKRLIILNKKNLKKKVFVNLINQLNTPKYFVLNNYNNFNLNIKKIDLDLKAKLINTSQARVLNLPFSGVTKLVRFYSTFDLKKNINLIQNFKLDLKIVCLKINKKFYLFSKIYQNLIINFISKKEFVKKNLLLTFNKLTNFFF